jgi:hypothetical protein
MKQTEAHLEKSGFGGWVTEKTGLRREAAPLSLPLKVKASRSQKSHPQHLTIPPVFIHVHPLWHCSDLRLTPIVEADMHVQKSDVDPAETGA